MSPDDYIATSIGQTLVARLTRTHERRRISVFSGPPGIGKSKAIARFCELNREGVARVQLGRGPKEGLRSGAALQAAAEALAELVPLSEYLPRMPRSMGELRSRIFGLVCQWANFDPYRARRNDMPNAPLLSIVIDEAQYLHPEGIDALRALNDRGGGFSPFPIAVSFVGNNRFVLKSDGRAESVLEDQVRDRLLYTEVLGYSDVADGDLALYFEAQGLVDAEALRVTLQYFASGRIDRSFRRAEDFVADLKEEAAAGPITINTVRHLLALA